MKHIFLLGFFFLVFLLKAQHWCLVQYHTLIKNKHEIFLSGCANYSSTSMSNSLTKNGETLILREQCAF